MNKSVTIGPVSPKLLKEQAKCLTRLLHDLGKKKPDSLVGLMFVSPKDKKSLAGILHLVEHIYDKLVPPESPKARRK